MPERRYTDEEVAAIFERAAEPQQQSLPAPDGRGMTLAALQEIGREVGFSPEAIAQAAHSLEQRGRPGSRTLLGVRVGVGRTVEVDGAISEASWERLVADLRETFRARGVVYSEGVARHWSNGNLQALVEPTPAGHRVRLQTIKGNSRTMMVGGLGALGIAATTMIATAAAGTLGTSSSITGIGLLAATGVGLFALGALQLPSWARRRSAQIENVLTRHATASVPKSLQASDSPSAELPDA